MFFEEQKRLWRKIFKTNKSIFETKVPDAKSWFFESMEEIKIPALLPKPRSIEISNIIEELSDDEILEARLAVARRKFWTPDIEKLLRKWRNEINKAHTEHKIAEKKYHNRYYAVGAPATILATVVASGILSTFKNCNPCTAACDPNASAICASDQPIRIAMGIVGIISIIFSGLMLFMGYQQASRDNKYAADDYDKLNREIDAILTTPIAMRGDPISQLQQIRSTFGDIAKSSPTISSKISLEYKHIKKKSVNFIGPRPEDGRLDLKKPGVKTLAKLLVNHVENDATEAINLRNTIIRENDYDTDEEDREVAIPFNIESLRPEDILNRDNGVQQSLTKALEFELSRLYSGEPKVYKESNDAEKITASPKKVRKTRRAKLKALDTLKTGLPNSESFPDKSKEEV